VTIYKFTVNVGAWRYNGYSKCILM